MADPSASEVGIARSLGQCVGHILSAVRGSRSDATTVRGPEASMPGRTVGASVREATVDGITYRRIVVDQIVGDPTTTVPHADPTT
ncbi:MAG: hypothetical protein EXS03_01755 [Phycisphaerales bacterium]|nr:hypothetical protein [Phycisphaerales bacterium]